MDLEFFVNLILVIPKKKENLLRSFLTILEQKLVESLPESVRNDGKGLSKA